MHQSIGWFNIHLPSGNPLSSQTLEDPFIQIPALPKLCSIKCPTLTCRSGKFDGQVYDITLQSLWLWIYSLTSNWFDFSSSKLNHDAADCIYSELFKRRSEHLHINLKIKHVYSNGKPWQFRLKFPTTSSQNWHIPNLLSIDNSKMSVGYPGRGKWGGGGGRNMLQLQINWCIIYHLQTIQWFPFLVK